MKKLILVRHGKSSWKTNQEDRNRPLKKRGLKDGEIIANAFPIDFKRKAKIYTSPALRAKSTAEIFKTILQIADSDFEVVEELYTFDDEQVLDFIKSCDDSLDHIFIFGHNPAFTALANDLGSLYFDNLPTTGLVMIEFSNSKWKEIKKGKTILTLIPKDFKK